MNNEINYVIHQSVLVIDSIVGFCEYLAHMPGIERLKGHLAIARGFYRFLHKIVFGM